MTDEHQENSTSDQIIAVLNEGRANPYHLREETGARKQQINKILNRLRAQGKVKKVCRGLYALDETATDPDPQDDGMPAHSTLDTSSTDGRCPSCATWALREYEDRYVCRECEAEFTRKGGDSAGDSR